MDRHKILVAEDDLKTADLLRLYLEREGHWVLISVDGRQALEIARTKDPDLIILDLMLPTVDGLDICRTLRRESHVPIIMLTARSTEDDVLRGLDLGADDYMTKPFSPREVVARVRAVLRRVSLAPFQGTAPLCFGDLVIDSRRHQARLAGADLHLTPREFKILETMARHPGRAFNRLELLETAFGFDYGGMERTVDAHIVNLRKKIETDPSHPRFIETVYGIGYRFGVDADLSAAVRPSVHSTRR